VQTATGLFGIGLTQQDIRELGAKVGDKVTVTSRYVEVDIEATPSPRSMSSRQPEVEVEGGGSGGSLKARIKAMKVGQVIEVSASAAKSGAYSVAKALGYKVKKESNTSVKRVS
jgi:hypothetical protein